MLWAAVKLPSFFERRSFSAIPRISPPPKPAPRPERGRRRRPATERVTRGALSRLRRLVDPHAGPGVKRGCRPRASPSIRARALWRGSLRRCSLDPDA